MKCEFSLLVEMADQRPGVRRGCQFSLPKSCAALQRGFGGETEDKRQIFNATKHLVDIATPLMNPEPQQQELSAKKRAAATDVWGAFTAKRMDIPAITWLQNYKSRLQITQLLEPVPLSTVIFWKTKPHPSQEKKKKNLIHLYSHIHRMWPFFPKRNPKRLMQRCYNNRNTEYTKHSLNKKRQKKHSTT